MVVSRRRGVQACAVSTCGTFAVYGREGYLSTSNAGPEIDNYTTNIKAREYYFVSEGKADWCTMKPR